MVYILNILGLLLSDLSALTFLPIKDKRLTGAESSEHTGQNIIENLLMVIFLNKGF